MAQKRLDKTARAAGVTVIKGAPVNDRTAVSVNRYTGGSSTWINLISLLGTRGLTVETNWKETSPRSV